MKNKIASAIAVIAILCATLSADAKGGDWLVKAGISNSSLDLNRDIGSVVSDVFSEDYFKSYTGFNAGIGYQTGSMKGFTLQPELLYNISGVAIDDVTDLSIGYLTGAVGIQWGIDLVILRPFLQLSPYLGYTLSNKVSGTSGISSKMQEYSDTAGRISYGTGVGAGIDIFNRLQLSVMYDWSFGSLNDVKEYAAQLKDIQLKNASCLKLSLALFL